MQPGVRKRLEQTIEVLVRSSGTDVEKILAFQSLMQALSRCRAPRKRCESMVDHPSLGRVYVIELQQIPTARFRDADNGVYSAIQRLLGPQHLLRVPKYLWKALIGTVMMSRHKSPAPYQWHWAVRSRMVDVHLPEEWNDGVAQNFIYEIALRSRAQCPSKAHHAYTPRR